MTARAMQSDRLGKLLRPRAVAVVGASEAPGNGRNAVQNLLEIGYSGGIYPVNSRYDSVLGLTCYSSLAALPERPDAVYIGIGAEKAVEEVRTAGALGIPAAVVHAGGFAEIGKEGAKLQDRLAVAASESGVTICGPNCLGLINVHDKVMLYGASMPRELEPGPIGAVFQSGSTLLALMNAGRDLRFSYLISSGNEAVLDSSDYFDFLVDDPGTRLIIGFIDGFRKPDRFAAMAERAAKVNKPIILLKPGRSEAGRQAALAHTGALAGSDEVMEAMFRRYGVVRALDLNELVEMSVLFSRVSRVPDRSGVIITAVSGGEMAIVLDSAADYRVDLPVLSTPVKEKIEGKLPKHIKVANPLDMTATGLYQPDFYRQALLDLDDDPGCGLVAVSQDFPGGMGEVQSQRYQDAARAFVEAAEDMSKPLVVFSNLSGGIDQKVRAILNEGNVPLLLGTRESMKAVAELLRFGARNQRLSADASCDIGSSPTFDDAALEAFRAKLKAGDGPLSEQDSKRLLSQVGIRVPREVLAETADRAADAADAIGYPVVLKVASADIPHKTEAGGVRLNLSSRHEVAEAWGEIMSSARAYAPSAWIDGVSVQEQIVGGLEMIVGCSRDEQFGPVILFGLGGIFVEIMKDVQMALAPLGRGEAETLFRSLRGFPLFDGARGRPRADVPAVIDTLVRLSQLASAMGSDLQALDINPLLVLPEGRGVVAADALIVPRSTLDGRGGATSAL